MPTFYVGKRYNLLLFQSIPENGGGKIRLTVRRLLSPSGDEHEYAPGPRNGPVKWQATAQNIAQHRRAEGGLGWGPGHARSPFLVCALTGGLTTATDERSYCKNETRHKLLKYFC